MGILSPPTSPALIKRLLPRMQVVGTRGQALGQDTNGALGGGTPSNYTRAESRLRSIIGPADVCDLRLLYGNYTLTAGSGDAAGPNDITIEAAIELVDANPFSYPSQFRGAPTGIVSSGAAGSITDAVGIDVPAGSAVWMRTGVTVSSGQQWPRGPSASVTGEKAAESTSASSQILATGALATPSGGAAANCYAPLALLGTPYRPMPAVLILGDSIADGSGDAASGDTEGNRGFAARGLRNSDGSVTPWVKVTMPSDNPIAQRLFQSWRRKLPWQYCTHLLNEHGGNQLANVTASVMLDHLRRIWLQGRRRGMHVTQVLLGPRTTSTDSWATAAGQAGFQSGFDPGGKRDQLNALIRTALSAGEIDAIIDPNAVWEDPVNPGKWVTSGAANYPTTDGTHPSVVLHAAAAALVNTWARRLTA